MKFLNKNKYFILSFFIPLIIYFSVFYINGLFNDNMMIMGDSLAQYYPFMHYLKGVFSGTNSILYSFYNGLGGPMIGTYFYYLSSPFNLLLVFVNQNNILLFMTILTILKLSLSGLTMYVYMSNKFKKNDITILSFSLLYSFMGYNLNYFLEIMWLDVVLLTPLVLLGIDKIIKNKSPILYIFTLFISIYSNYYISYMLCIFVVLYFFYELNITYDFKNNKKYVLNIIKNFFITSLLTGLMCSFFIIPCFLEMLSYNRTNSLKEIFYFDYNIFNLLAKTYIGTIDGANPFNTNAINIYCGIITIPLVYLYFKNKNINKKNKISTAIIIIFMILPCFIGIFNYIWHLFTLPIGFCYRYSFLLCLFLILIAYKSYINLEINKIRIMNYLAIYISYSVIIIFINYFKNYYNYINYYYIWLTCALLIIYIIILFKIKNKNLLNILIFFLILLESILNVYLSFNKYEFNDIKYIKNQNEIFKIVKQYNMDNRISDKYLNNSYIENYMSVNNFLSTYNSNNYKILYELNNIFNMDSANNFSHVENLSYISDSILGINYIISKDINYNYNLIGESTSNDTNYYIYENKTKLSLGWIVKNNCNNIKKEKFYDENVFNCLTENNIKYYKEYKNESNEINKYKFNINKGYYYLYIDNLNDNINYLKDILNSNIIEYYDNYLFVKNELENYTLNLESNSNIHIYYFDYELYKETFNSYKKELLECDINKNALTGSITTDGGILLITIPYDKNLNIYVDDIEVKYERVLDTFIGINLENGNHKIKIIYEPKYIKLSALISLISLTILIFISRKIKYIK